MSIRVHTLFIVCFCLVLICVPEVPLDAQRRRPSIFLPKATVKANRRELQARINQTHPLERKYILAPYVCDKSRPEITFRSAIDRTAIEKGAFEHKDGTGIYVKGLGKTHNTSWQTEQHYIKRLSEWKGGTPTAELIIFENWSIKKACAVWIFADRLGPIYEFDLLQELPKQIRRALGVIAGARGELSVVVKDAIPSSTEAIERISTSIFPPSLSLSGIERVLIRPGGVTSQLPFLALKYRGERVGARFALILPDEIKPKYQVANIPRHSHEPHDDDSNGVFKSALVVGDPDFSWDKLTTWRRLNGTIEEAKKVATLFKTEPLMRKDATKAEIILRLSRADYIHFATHGVTDEKNPMDGSFIVLADGYLMARDVQRAVFFFYNHPIVVLSACQTGLGKPFEGGTYGLARSFLTIGADQVLANLWNVDDMRSGSIAAAFAERIAQGKGGEFALQEVIKSEVFADPDTPAYWGSFILYGKPTGHGMIEEDDPIND